MWQRKVCSLSPAGSRFVLYFLQTNCCCCCCLCLRFNFRYDVSWERPIHRQTLHCQCSMWVHVSRSDRDVLGRGSGVELQLQGMKLGRNTQTAQHLWLRFTCTQTPRGTCTNDLQLSTRLHTQNRRTHTHSLSANYTRKSFSVPWRFVSTV